MSGKAGIASVGVHVPRYRLTGKLLAQVWGAGGAGERAVANYDEAALTHDGGYVNYFWKFRPVPGEASKPD